MAHLFKQSKRKFATTQIFNNILETIGNTPVVRVNKLAPKNVDMFVKCEYFNPLSSVKDRLAKGIIEDAEHRGVLKPNQTVIEATSGNTGIALAMVCAQKGYPFVATMAETFSIERRKIMRALGAKVILTPAKDGGVGMVKKAEELSKANGWFLTRQFENDANWQYHAQTTGPEILSAFAGKRLDYWVVGYGTGGAFSGVGKVLKTARPNVKVILSEPESAPLIQSGHGQERDENGAAATGHPAFTPHPIQHGLDLNIADEIVSVGGQDAMKCALDLAKYEGIFTGISGGAGFATALEVAQRAPDGSTIVAMLPDTMERYMSTPLFENIAADMNEEEIELAKTSPNYLL